MKIGTQIRVERDEALYPSKGTWPRFRGRVGTIVEINRDRKHPHLTEYGVTFGKMRKPDRFGSVSAGAATVWFKLRELTEIAEAAPQRPVEGFSRASACTHVHQRPRCVCAPASETSRL